MKLSNPFLGGVFTGLLFMTSASAEDVVNASLPKGVISIPLPRIENQSAYGVEFQVGTPPQVNILKLDTGSPTMGFEDPDSNECLQSNDPCALYGSYDNETSTTAVYAGAPYSDMLNDHATGFYVNDTFRFAGVTVESINFGIKASIYAAFYEGAPDAGIFGMGQNCNDQTCTSYNTFLQQLYDQGVVSTRAFSLYLGPDDADTVGALLLGGIDKAKQDGTVYTIPVINVTSNDANQQPFQLNITSFSTTLGTNTTKYDIPSGTSGLVDTGNPAWMLPDPVWPVVRDYFGISPDLRDYATPFTIDCKFREPSSDTIEVEFPGNASITIAMDQLVTKLVDGSCVTYISGSGTALGDPFLRNVYAVLDMDSHTISLSQVKHTNETDIVAI